MSLKQEINFPACTHFFGKLVSDLNYAKIVGSLYWEQNDILVKRVNFLRSLESCDELC
jgi:hypothetical protein